MSHEAHRPNIQSEVLAAVANIVRRDVYDWQHFFLFRIYLEDGFAPFVIMVLLKIKSNKKNPFAPVYTSK